jgi:peptidoglycan-N-acetylglucosamine deacetylase
VRALAVTIDLDSPTEYAGLHGVAIPAEDPHLPYRGPLDRFAALCRSLGGTGTAFAIARDVAGIAAEKLRTLDSEGFEIGCHSFAHDYRLTERVDGEIARDLRRAKKVFEDELGMQPLGFRAPGYHVSNVIFDELEELGFTYDSSVFPSPAYWLLKAAVLTSYRARGRSSVSLLGSPRGTFAPRQPYRPGRDPYERGSRRLVELPITVATPLRLPVTGASLLLTPAPVRALLLRALASEEVVVVNLHAMELIDPESDGLPQELVRFQPELQRPLAEREAALREILGTLAKGRRVITCGEIARDFAG